MSRQVTFRRRTGRGLRSGRSAGSRGPLIAAAVGAVGFVLAVVLLISVIALIGSGDGLTAGRWWSRSVGSWSSSASGT